MDRSLGMRASLRGQTLQTLTTKNELHDSCSQILAESALALTTHIQVTMLIYHVFL